MAMAAGFREGFVEADGFHIRYMEAGEGPALTRAGASAIGAEPHLDRKHPLLPSCAVGPNLKRGQFLLSESVFCRRAGESSARHRPASEMRAAKHDVRTDIMRRNQSAWPIPATVTMLASRRSRSATPSR